MILRDPAISGRLRRVLVVAVCLSLAAVLGGAVFLGWRVHDWLADKPQTVISVKVERPIRAVEEKQPVPGTMPNVLGLDQQTARQLLADAGLDPKRVSTTTRPYAGDQAVVIAQDPSAGSPTVTAKLALTLSAPATMPNLAGTALADARSALAAVGASVLVKTRYEPNATENTVLETDPQAGKPLTDRATVVIAEPPSSVFLNQLRAIDSSCGAQTLNVAGVERQDALMCEPGEGSPSVMEYLLNGRVAAFATVVGLGDRGGTDTPVIFRVFVDGKRVLAQTLRFGQTNAITVPVVGALRMHVEAAIVTPGPSGQRPQAVFADARFLGGRSAIDNLVAESHQ